MYSQQYIRRLRKSPATFHAVFSGNHILVLVTKSPKYSMQSRPLGTRSRVKGGVYISTRITPYSAYHLKVLGLHAFPSRHCPDHTNFDHSRLIFPNEEKRKTKRWGDGKGEGKGAS